MRTVRLYTAFILDINRELMCMHFRILLSGLVKKEEARRDIALVVHLYKGIRENSKSGVNRFVLSRWQIKNDLGRNIALVVHLYMGIGENSISFECICAFREH